MGSQPEQEDSVISKFLQYRDGGKTDEKGISTHLYGLFQGQVTNGLAVTQDSPLGMSVLVSKGRCMIDSADDYPYLGFTDANEVVTITAADGSNPRIDAIVAYVDLSVVDSTNSNNPGAFEIVAVAGTPAGSPNPPDDSAVSTAIGLGNPFIRLAHVTVGAGVTTITTGNVSDQRVFVGLPDGFIRSSDTLGQSVKDLFWWEELARQELESANASVTVNIPVPKKYLRVYFNQMNPSTASSVLMRFNNDSGNNYSYRYTSDDQTAVGASSQSSIQLIANTSANYGYYYMDIFSDANSSTLGGCKITRGTVGTASVARDDISFLWSGSSSPISRIDIFKPSGTWGVGSSIVVLGHN